MKLLLLILTPDLWQWSPQTFFCPAVAATRSRSLQQSGKAKRTVRKGHNVLLTIFSIKLLLLILTPDLWEWSPKTIFWATIAATHSRSFREDGSTKRTVRKDQVLMYVFVLHSPCFLIKLLFSCPTHNLWQWRPQTEFCPAVATMRWH